MMKNDHQGTYLKLHVGIAPQCPHPTPPLAMLGCEKSFLRPCTDSFNIHNSISSMTSIMLQSSEMMSKQILL